MMVDRHDDTYNRIVFFLIILQISIAWISYKGKVYDVSSWEDHPGAG